MENPTLIIDNLLIRVPGLTPDRARSLGREIGRLLAADPPAVTQSRQLGALSLKLEAAESDGHDKLAAQIAGAVRRGVR
ncbi:MAG: hypothetical protein P8107_12020 [Spirochaetia bacterium]